MVVTLLTDFGTRDEYVGVLKGVMLSINPQVVMVDLSHQLAPQDIVTAGFMLRSAYRYFPSGTVHLAIVDPGVGTDRWILAARCNHHLFLAPDNGLLPMVWDKSTPDSMVRVDNSALFRHPVSRTFHGRDIFAPVAAHLSNGMDLEDIGPAVTLSQIKGSEIKGARWHPSGELVGEIVRVDRFGNLITNIKMDQVGRLADGAPPPNFEIWVGDCCIQGLAQNYAEGSPQVPLALAGSHNCLEIALRGGSAAKFLGVGQGAKVNLKTRK